MGRRERASDGAMFTFFLYTVSLLFSSELNGSLKLFGGSVLGSSFSELLEGCMDGGVVLVLRGSVVKKKKKRAAMPMST
ncbi:hypothetical protein C7212DRAFT_311424, partial [Tuber magnatum]